MVLGPVSPRDLEASLKPTPAKAAGASDLGTLGGGGRGHPPQPCWSCSPGGFSCDTSTHSLYLELLCHAPALSPWPEEFPVIAPL